MRKLILILTVSCVSLTLSAQYKKASFFGKDGRTYELGTDVHFLGGGRNSPMGYKFAMGRDREGKRLFTSWEMGVISPISMEYKTTDYNNSEVTVKCKTSYYYVFGLNYDIHLLKNEGEFKRIQPFVHIGLNTILFGMRKEEQISPEYVAMYDLNKQIMSDEFSAGAGPGIGTLVNFTKKLGLKIHGGYVFQWNIKETGVSAEPYFVFPSHPYASLTLRLRVEQD